jgi:hypothetical protein
MIMLSEPGQLKHLKSKLLERNINNYTVGNYVVKMKTSPSGLVYARVFLKRWFLKPREILEYAILDRFFYDKKDEKHLWKLYNALCEEAIIYEVTL